LFDADRKVPRTRTEVTRQMRGDHTSAHEATKTAIENRIASRDSQKQAITTEPYKVHHDVDDYIFVIKKKR